MAKSFLKILSILFILIVVAIGIIILTQNESIPSGVTGKEADDLALRMEAAVRKSSWNNIHWVTWTSPGEKIYVWDKYSQLLQVEWGGKRVIINLKNKEGKAWQEEQSVSGNTAKKFIKTAWENFCNDSFWFIAPNKAFDSGVTREIVNLENGEKGLKIIYAKGGVTPGDSYLWEFDSKTDLPKSYKMWVKILPIGGLKSTWSDWITLKGGARVATSRKIGPVTIKIEDIKSGNSYKDLGLKSNPFLPLLSK